MKKHRIKIASTLLLLLSMMYIPMDVKADCDTSVAQWWCNYSNNGNTKTCEKKGDLTSLVKCKKPVVTVEIE